MERGVRRGGEGGDVAFGKVHVVYGPTFYSKSGQNLREWCGDALLFPRCLSC